MDMTDQEFYRISSFLKGKYGIDMSHKKEIINGRLENYLKQKGFDSYTAYFNAMNQDITGHLERKLVNMLSTNHTYFMREPEHFEYLRRVILPWLRQKEQVNRDLCIWCAASSSGEEPYTIAMTLKEFFGLEADKWDTKVLATDISTDVLRQAQAGVYKAEAVKTLPENWRRRFFRLASDGEHYVVSKELKDEVIFRKFNLMDPLPFRRKMHVVFLRNVMIYFDDETKRDLIQRIYNVMEPGGYLIVGQTETIDRGATPFQMIRPSIFRKPEKNA